MSYTSNTSSDTITVTAPADIQDGDLLLVYGFQGSNTYSAPPSCPGFDVTHHSTYDFVMSKFASGESGDYTFTWLNTAANAIIIMAVYRNVKDYNLGNSESYTTSSSSTAPTMFAANGALVAFFAIAGSRTTSSTLTDMTRRLTTPPAIPSATFYDKFDQTSGFSGAKNISWSSSGGRSSKQVSLAPADVAQIPVDVLVVGGGGGGGSANNNSGGGGGGAGGVREFSTSVSSTFPFVVTVGAGGAGGSGGQGKTGSNSAVYYKLSSGGGAGGGNTSGGKVGYPGGSGGGGFGTYEVTAGVTYAGGSGVAGQGYAGGTGVCSNVDGAYQAGGGGGGASALGGDYQLVTGGASGGDGGDGALSSITGNYYGGGGGGGKRSTPTGSARAGYGGTGGGGDGGAGNQIGTAGTANSGGGGGGAGCNNALYVGGNGGSGIVVIRYPDSYPAAQTVGSPTIDVSGGYRTYTFTGSGVLRLV